MKTPDPADRRTILITGCSTGIGACAATGMAARGWRVFATARKEADLERLRQQGLEPLYLDYADPASIGSALAIALDATGGRLDALFNNGAYAQPGALEDLSADLLRAQFDANFFGWHELTRNVIPVMRRQGRGRIVMNSSVLGLVAMGYRGAYVATKFALEGYSDALRIELSGTGIHVSVIEPGPIRTEFTRTALRHAEKIDVEGSPHRDFYRRRLASMAEGGNSFGEMGPEAVLKALVAACESRNPKPQYFVTRPTAMAAAARRLLPKRSLDALFARATG